MSGEDRASDQLAARHTQTLRLFKRRAEELFSCELARRDDAMNLGQQLHMNFVVDQATGQSSLAGIRQVIPPKEQVAYALTLIRPLTLTKKGDRLAWVTVLAALEYFRPADATNVSEHLTQLRENWAQYPPRRMRIMQAPIDPEAAGVRVNAWDNEIARMFLYGDLVHGDDNAELLDALGDDQVVFSAGAMASDGFMLVNNTYQVMHWLRPDIAPNDAHYYKLLAQEKPPKDN